MVGANAAQTVPFSCCLTAKNEQSFVDFSVTRCPIRMKPTHPVGTYLVYLSTKSQPQRVNQPRMARVQPRENSSLISKLVKNEQTFAVFSVVRGALGTKPSALVQLC